MVRDWCGSVIVFDLAADRIDRMRDGMHRRRMRNLARWRSEKILNRIQYSVVRCPVSKVYYVYVLLLVTLNLNESLRADGDR
jgi:CRISPR/Cas system-associated endoribonuclease Cas2